MRGKYGTLADNDRGVTTAIGTGGHVNAAEEGRIEGHEAQHRLQSGRIEYLHVRTATRPSAGNDFGFAVACYVGGRDPDTARKGRGIGHEAVQKRSGIAVKDLHVWTTA